MQRESERSRPRRFETPGEARFLTFSCFQRKPLLDPEWARDLFAEHLALTRDRLGFRLYAWVAMPEHVHLLLDPDLAVAKVPRILSALKGRASTKALERIRQTEGRAPAHFWQPGKGYDRNIHSDREFHEKLDYIEENPVRRGLVARPEEYLWSSAGCPFLGRDRW